MKPFSPVLRTLSAATLLVLLSVGRTRAADDRPQTLELRLEKREYNLPVRSSALRSLQSASGPLKAVLPEVKGLPQGWEAITVEDDFPQALYQGFCAGKVDTALCMRYFNAWKKDTARYASTPAWVFLSLAFARDAEGTEWVMYDTDGDGDFAGEARYRFEERPARVKMAYERTVNKRACPDTTWVEITDVRGVGRCLIAREMTAGVFTTGGRAYTCTVLPVGTSYQDPTIRIASSDTTADYALREFARLGEAWYRLDSLSPDGRFLRMTRVADVGELESTQVGFRPYAFEAVDLTGRKVRFPDDFAGKYVLLDFWALGCAPCREDICHVYPDVYARFRDAGFEIVGVADDKGDDLRSFVAAHALPWTVIADRDQASSVHAQYGIVQYPTLLLIGPDGRIVDKEGNLRVGLDRVLSHYLPSAAEGEGH